MPVDVKPGKRVRKLLGITFSLVSLAVLSYIAIALITGRDIGLKRIFGSIASHEPVEEVDELMFEVGRSGVFADLGGAVAAAGTLGIQVLDRGGNELLRDPFRMTAPAIGAAGGRAIAFDLGMTAVRVFDAGEVAAAFETEDAIISASINENGWFCVSARDSGGYTCVATVYNNIGKDVYRVRLASGYILSSVLSPDNERLAVLSLTDEGSRITFYRLDSEEIYKTIVLPDRLIIDIRYQAGGSVLAVTTDSLFIVDNNGEGRELYWFAGRRLGGYACCGGFIALHLLDYGVGNSGRLVTLKNDGTFLGTIPTDFEVISISSGADCLAILRGDGVTIYDMELSEIPYSGSQEFSAGADNILALADGAALVTSDHSAVVINLLDRNS